MNSSDSLLTRYKTTPKEGGVFSLRNRDSVKGEVNVAILDTFRLEQTMGMHGTPYLDVLDDLTQEALNETQAGSFAFIQKRCEEQIKDILSEHFNYILYTLKGGGEAFPHLEKAFDYERGSVDIDLVHAYFNRDVDENILTEDERDLIPRLANVFQDPERLARILALPLAPLATDWIVKNGDESKRTEQIDTYIDSHMSDFLCHKSFKEGGLMKTWKTRVFHQKEEFWVHPASPDIQIEPESPFLPIDLDGKTLLGALVSSKEGLFLATKEKLIPFWKVERELFSEGVEPHLAGLYVSLMTDEQQQESKKLSDDVALDLHKKSLRRQKEDFCRKQGQGTSSYFRKMVAAIL